MRLVPPRDALYLWLESESCPTSVVALQVFQLPDGAGPQALDTLYAEMTDPRAVKESFRRRVHRSAATGGQFAWTEVDELDMSKHVTRHVLPQPGRVRELLQYVGALHARRLDRDRPLWEGHLVQGLEGNRFALCTKLHPAGFDGVNMARHVLSGLSTDPRAKNCGAPWIDTRRPAKPREPRPAGRRLSPGKLLDTGRSLATSAGALARAGRSAVVSRELAVPFRAPDSIFNRRVDSSRRFAGDAWPLERLKAVAAQTDCTVNDVALAICAGALRGYLTDRNALPDRPLVAMVPMSLASAEVTGGPTEGNWDSFGATLCSLGTDLADPVARLRHIHDQTARNKTLMADLDPTAAALYSTANLTPSVLASIPRVPRLPRPGFNLVISNVPGIRKQLYLSGSKLTATYPVSIVPDRQGLNITMASYLDTLQFGFVGCATLVPHLQRLLVHTGNSLAELEKAAHA